MKKRERGPKTVGGVGYGERERGKDDT